MIQRNACVEGLKEIFRVKEALSRTGSPSRCQHALNACLLIIDDINDPDAPLDIFDRCKWSIYFYLLASQAALTCNHNESILYYATQGQLQISCISGLGWDEKHWLKDCTARLIELGEEGFRRIFGRLPL